jgi:BolA family transcriptional regulator, general stress-responsive regulator
MSKQYQKISELLNEGFQPSHFELVNESFMHNVPKGSESHFKAVIVSEAFEGKRLVQRHQLVYAAMGEVMKEIHALALHTFTAKEWQERAKAEDSPKCKGGE